MQGYAIAFASASARLIPPARFMLAHSEQPACIEVLEEIRARQTWLVMSEVFREVRIPFTKIVLLHRAAEEPS